MDDVMLGQVEPILVRLKTVLAERPELAPFLLAFAESLATAPQADTGERDMLTCVGTCVASALSRREARGRADAVRAVEGQLALIRLMLALYQ